MRDLRAFKATEDSRRLTLPQSPDAFQPKLPKDFQAPQGIEYAVDPNHPLMTMARQFAHKHGLSQEGFEEFLALHAANEIGTLTFIQKAREGEIGKLGATGPARVAAIETWVDSRLPEELAAPVKTMLVSEKIVRGFEKLMADFRGAGAGAPAPSRGPDEQAGKIEGFEKMSFREQRAAQDALAAPKRASSH